MVLQSDAKSGMVPFVPATAPRDDRSMVRTLGGINRGLYITHRQRASRKIR